MITTFMVPAVLISALTVLTPVAQSTGVVWVDDDTCPAVGSGTYGKPFCSIQDACERASDGSEIRVLPGLYEECVDCFDAENPNTLHLIA